MAGSNFNIEKLTKAMKHHKLEGETVHPLASLQPDELRIAARVVKAANPGKVCLFRRILLIEPPKSGVVPVLEAEIAGEPLPQGPIRRSQALFYFQGETEFMEAIVDITHERMLGQRHLEGEHGPGDDEEVLEIAKASLESALVKKELERLQLPEGSEVIAEPWPYGSDDTETPTRMSQVWFFLNYKDKKDHPSANFYAHPLDFSCAVEIATMEVVRIDRLPTDLEMTNESQTARFVPNPDCEYAPDLLPGGVRQDLKPLHISQPEGVSFRIAPDGETITWQKWSFRCCFDVREGMILRNVCYDGRPLFYRMALSEMTVPYGDPRSPLHRKSAFDLGECGAGQTANNLQLGCDCLGVIAYLDGLSCSHDGEPVVIPNAICIHEQDAGLGWKHTNIRTGRADVTRARELVLQLIVTVGNYEYCLYWIFDTAANLHYEIRATGIMSVTPADPSVDLSTLGYGNVVAEGVFAPHHQHVFNLRIDPAIDSYRSSAVTYEDTHAMPRDPATNPCGVGFVCKSTQVQNESAFNLEHLTNRYVKMINPNKRNKFTKKPIGYKISAPPTQLGLADPTSMHYIRGEFTDHHVHVTKYHDAELWGSGEHLWQSRGGRGGCRTWASRGREMEDDAVLWFTLGFTHITRPEDWPVMPSETFRMHFKPVGFFDENPALDVPPSTQAVNKSVLANGSARPHERRDSDSSNSSAGASKCCRA
ncbi:putative Primary-amine oxidase [Rhodotorula taiwanensis]|uniref:Amine oxidase n=1 Tax=Rhodotorula taiwanensis TaxID=741276 RepID=A0A2S5BD13_9BASI|nr:putative Primary-amine oxidase [Rhodotorula taiwanensis]